VLHPSNFLGVPRLWPTIFAVAAIAIAGCASDPMQPPTGSDAPPSQGAAAVIDQQSEMGAIQSDERASLETEPVLAPMPAVANQERPAAAAELASQRNAEPGVETSVANVTQEDGAAAAVVPPSSDQLPGGASSLDALLSALKAGSAGAAPSGSSESATLASKIREVLAGNTAAVLPAADISSPERSPESAHTP